MPAIKISECCEGLDKFIKEDLIGGCKSECKAPSPGSMCCMGKCFGEKLGMFNSGNFDKATALNSLSAAFGSDQTWNTVSISNSFKKSASDLLSDTAIRSLQMLLTRASLKVTTF